MKGSQSQTRYQQQFEVTQDADGHRVYQWCGAGIENLSSIKLMDILAETERTTETPDQTYVSAVKAELVRRNYFLQDELVGDC